MCVKLLMHLRNKYSYLIIRFAYQMLITWTRMACISGVVFIVESQPTTKNVVLLYYGFAILLHLMRGVW